MRVRLPYIARMNIEHFLLLDIETVPQQPSFYLLDEQWQQLWTEKASRYPFPAEQPPETSYTQRAAILAEFGKIICISTGYFYTDRHKQYCLHIHTLSGHNEKTLLEQFLLTVQQFIRRKKIFEFAGHNIKEFDIPYICRRMTVHGLPLPACLQLNGQKPWETQIFDTLGWWKFGDYKNYISLKLLSAVLGLPSAKEGMDGSMVQEVYYREKDLSRIATYCAGDVEAVGRILLKFQNVAVPEPVRITSEFTTL